MSTWFDWAMGNSKFESLPQHIKDTTRWQRYQTTINEREVQLTVAKRRLAEAKQAAEEWATEQLEEEADNAKHSARNAKAEQKGGRRKRRHTKRRHRKRRIKTRRGHRRRGHH